MRQQQQPYWEKEGEGGLVHPNILLLKNAAAARMPGHAGWRPADLQAIHRWAGEAVGSVAATVGTLSSTLLQALPY